MANIQFSASVQQAVVEFIASAKDAGDALAKARKGATASIYRTGFNLAMAIKADAIVMAPESANTFGDDLAEKAGRGEASLIVGAVLSNVKRVACATLAEFEEARAQHKGSDLKALAALCPAISTKGRKAKPKGETPKGETPKGETPKGETPKGETPKGETSKNAAALAVVRQRLEFAAQIAAKNKGVNWTAIGASIKVAMEALDSLEL